MHNSIIFRLQTMYGWNHSDGRSNPVTWLIKYLKEGRKTPVVTDVYNNHLWVHDAARTTWKAIDKNMFGNIFHVAGGNCVDRFSLSLLVAETFGLDKNLLFPVTDAYFPTIAPRPRNTCFDITKLQHVLKIQPLTTSEGLREMKKKYEN